MFAILKQDEIEAGIKRKGFRQSNRDHRYYILYVGGKKEGATFLSHGRNQDIGPSLLNAVSKELGISLEDFIDFIRCPLSTEDYLQKKKEKLEEGLRILRRAESGKRLAISPKARPERPAPGWQALARPARRRSPLDAA